MRRLVNASVPTVCNTCEAQMSPIDRVHLQLEANYNIQRLHNQERLTRKQTTSKILLKANKEAYCNITRVMIREGGGMNQTIHPSFAQIIRNSYFFSSPPNYN